MPSRIPGRSLALGLLACVALGGCDRGARECEALRKVTDAPSADAGAADPAQAADRAVADLDAITTRTPQLATVRADYRASLVAVATTRRSVHDAMAPVMGAAVDAAGGPGLKIEFAAEEGPLEDRLSTLARPCLETMFSGLGNLFQKDAGAPPPPAAKADCDRLGPI